MSGVLLRDNEVAVTMHESATVAPQPEIIRHIVDGQGNVSAEDTVDQWEDILWSVNGLD